MTQGLVLFIAFFPVTWVELIIYLSIRWSTPYSHIFGFRVEWHFFNPCIKLSDMV